MEKAGISRTQFEEMKENLEINLANVGTDIYSLLNIVNGGNQEWKGDATGGQRPGTDREPSMPQY